MKSILRAGPNANLDFLAVWNSRHGWGRHTQPPTLSSSVAECVLSSTDPGRGCESVFVNTGRHGSTVWHTGHTHWRQPHWWLMLRKSRALGFYTIFTLARPGAHQNPPANTALLHCQPDVGEKGFSPYHLIFMSFSESGHVIDFQHGLKMSTYHCVEGMYNLTATFWPR